MPSHLKKYYTFKDEFHIEVGIDFCLLTIKGILKTYKKETLFRSFSSIAQNIGLGNDFNSILQFQQDQFRIPIHKEALVVHRYATCVIFQFLFSIIDEEYGDIVEINMRDVFLIYILVNQLTEICEGASLNKKKALNKKLFFTNIKQIHYVSNKDDLQAGFYLFKGYYQRIIQLNRELYNRIIEEEFGFNIEEYSRILDLIENRDYPNIFHLLEKFAVISFDKTHEVWEERKPKFDVPHEFPFLQKYPLLKINNSYLVTDLHSVFSSLFRILYQTLLEYDNISFKGDFGKNIVEPTIIDLLTEIFVDQNVRIIKVGSKKFEYGDFGLVLNNDIFLFEIKTSLLNNPAIYTNNYEIFMKIFNDKFVHKEGVSQQVKKIQSIEDNFDHFCSLSGVNKNEKYTIYPILAVFDESLMSFCCNWYLSLRFEVYKRIKKLRIQKIGLAPCHSTATFNEIYRMRYIDKNPSERLGLLKLYSDTKNKLPWSFSFFLQELNVFTLTPAN